VVEDQTERQPRTSATTKQAVAIQCTALRFARAKAVMATWAMIAPVTESI